MAAKPDAVTWPQFSWIVGILILILVAVLGVGFGWMHGDISSLTTKVSQIEVNTAITNTKLDALIAEAKRHR